MTWIMMWFAVLTQAHRELCITDPGLLGYSQAMSESSSRHCPTQPPGPGDQVGGPGPRQPEPRPSDLPAEPRRSITLWPLPGRAPSSLAMVQPPRLLVLSSSSIIIGNLNLNLNLRLLELGTSSCG